MDLAARIIPASLVAIGTAIVIIANIMFLTDDLTEEGAYDELGNIYASRKRVIFTAVFGSILIAIVGVMLFLGVLFGGCSPFPGPN